MSDIKTSLTELLSMDGAKYVSLVDSKSGMVLGAEGAGVDIELAAAGNSEVLKAKLKTMKALGLKSKIEDILITIDNQYHIIRPIATQEGLFLYMILDKDKSNLALARRKVQNVEEVLEL